MTAIKIDEGQILRQIEGSPRGVSSVYIQLDKKWGLKLFFYEYDRDYAYNLQSKAADFGLGPEVGEKINMSVKCKRPYGYITEHIKVLRGLNYHNIECNKNYIKAKRKLLSDITINLGIEHDDLHYNNIGYKNGKMICIDWGREGIFDPNEIMMLSKLIDNIYADWDLVKRIIKQEDPQLYEQWKAGGYLVDEDVLSMYPCLSQVLEKLEAEENVSMDEDDDMYELDEGEITYL